MKLVLVVALCCLAIHSSHGAPRTAVYKYVKCNPNGDQANCVTYQSPNMPWSSDLPEKIPASEAQFLEAKAVKDEELSDVGKDEPLEEEDMEEDMMQDKEDEENYLENEYEEELIGNEYEHELRVKENEEEEDEEADEDEDEEADEDEDEEADEDEDEDEDEDDNGDEEEDDDMLMEEQNENTGLDEDKMPLLGEEGESPTAFLSEGGSGSEEGSGGDVTDQLFVPFGGDVGSGDSLNEDANPAAKPRFNLRGLLKMSTTVMKPAEKELKDDHLLKQ